MKSGIKGVILALGLLAAAGPVGAATVFSEDFNAGGFQGGLQLPNNTSDRWAGTDYYRLNNFNGWTFTGDVFFARNRADYSDGAVLLNERSGPSTSASRTLTGLTGGQTYTVSFLFNGDNTPVGGGYSVLADVNAGSVSSFSGTVQAPGTNPGTLASFNFVAVSGSNVLRFRQTSSFDASPIIDNITVSTAAVPEPGTWALMIVGFGGAGAMLRRRRAFRTI